MVYCNSNPVMEGINVHTIVTLCVHAQQGGRVFGVSVCQFVCFVCLFVRFLACSGIIGLLELSFSFLQMAPSE